MSKVQRFKRNLKGRDFVVGDIHGHFNLLQKAIDAVGFDPAVDRLFSVGDLVDRGPESEHSIDWLSMPWFHAVRGNHEQMAIDSHRSGEHDLHCINGGLWFYALQWDERSEIVTRLSSLPIAIEVETASGMVGLVHADCPRRDWSDLIATLEQVGAEADHVEAMCQWSRKRITDRDDSFVQNVRAVIVGHTPLDAPTLLGNVYHIDTGGWMPERGGRFTLMNLETLEVVA